MDQEDTDNREHLNSGLNPILHFSDLSSRSLIIFALVLGFYYLIFFSTFIAFHFTRFLYPVVFVRNPLISKAVNAFVVLGIVLPFFLKNRYDRFFHLSTLTSYYIVVLWGILLILTNFSILFAVPFLFGFLLIILFDKIGEINGEDLYNRYSTIKRVILFFVIMFGVLAGIWINNQGLLS